MDSDLQLKKSLISSGVQLDTYYSMDYGFQYSDFLDAVDNNFGAHVKKGVAEYLNERINSGLNQIQILGNQTHPCLNSIINLERPQKRLIKIFDFLGRETIFKTNVPLFYIYDDGTVQKKIVLE